jgi:hypothetical protein
LKAYNSIRVPIDPEVSSKRQPLFIDLIIKITICCAYANLNNKKILTAEKVLESTRRLIGFIDDGKIHLTNEGRVEAPIIPLVVLK